MKSLILPRVVFLLAFSPLLNSCMLIEAVFFKPKKQDCPRYLDSWTVASKQHKKDKVLIDDPGAGRVVTANGDSLGLQIIRVPRNEVGLIAKNAQKRPRKNPDPRTGYKPHRKPFDPEKHN